MELLLKYRADPNLRMIDGDTPLITAINCGNNHYIPKLIEHGAEIETNDKYDNTPLLTAIAKVNTAAVNILLCNGANPFHKNRQGEDAHTLAQKISDNYMNEKKS